MMKLLVIGNDGRTHALIWKLFSSSQAEDIWCVPGNGGTGQLAKPAEPDDPSVAGMARWAFDNTIDLIVPASAEPISQGLTDEAIAFGVGVCGPSQRSAVQERSRCAAKAFMLRHKLPTAPGRPFDNPAMAEKFLATQPMPVIIKADHPALGERVFEDRYAAIAGLHELFSARPIQGENAGVVIESYIRGPRIVMSAFTDGRTSVPLLPVRLYDRVEDNDSGPLSPGVGAHTSHSRYATLLGEYLSQKLLAPIVAGLAAESLPYWGVLSIDTVIAADGPKITAIRTGFHEGEAQVVLPRLEDDLLPWLQAMVAQRLHEMPPPRFAPVASVGLGLFAKGYPNYFATGGVIQGLEDLDPGVLVFHRDTEQIGGQRASTMGGMFGLGGAAAASPAGLRVSGGCPVMLVASAATLAGARGLALANAERARFDGRQYRANIAAREFA